MSCRLIQPAAAPTLRPEWSPRPGFEKLRSQFERRRHAQFQDLAHALGEIDVGLFTEPTLCHQGVDPEFTMCGALPPTTACRGRDIATTVAISRSEKQAAQELIALSRPRRP